MEHYEWHGNVRELENVMHEALIAAAGPAILPDFLPAELHRTSAPTAASTDPAATCDSDLQGLMRFLDSNAWAGETDVYRRARDYFDRLLIQRALQQTAGNQQRARDARVEPGDAASEDAGAEFVDRTNARPRKSPGGNASNMRPRSETCDAPAPCDPPQPPP